MIAPGELRVASDLRIEVDGHRAWLDSSDDGRIVRLHADDPGALAHAAHQAVRALPRRAGSARSALAETADQLHELGLRLDVQGPRGSVITLGQVPDSRAGRWLLASPHARLGSSRAIGNALRGFLRRYLANRVGTS